MYNSYNQITDKLYIGDIMSPITSMEDNITHIISLVSLDENIKNVLKKKNITHIEHLFNDDENENIIKEFKVLSPKIENILKINNSKLLIHCMAGRSRSAGILILTLMKFYNLDFSKSYSGVESKREIGLNKRFFKDIKITKQI